MCVSHIYGRSSKPVDFDRGFSRAMVSEEKLSCDSAVSSSAE